MRKSIASTRLVRATSLAFSVNALLSAGSALAAGDVLYGGGANTPAEPYVGVAYESTVPNLSRLSSTNGNSAGAGFNAAAISNIGAGTPSIFLTFKTLDSDDISYCQTGSGFGKNSLNGVATALASSQCNDYSTNPSGLSAPTNSPDFVGTDTPYSTADYTAFLNGSQFASHVGIVQVPVLASAVALAHNPAISNVALTGAQVCKIYSGVITSWKSVAGVAGAKTSPVTIVYRTDSAGQSFSLTKFLAATCNGTTNVPSGFVFTPNSTFNSALSGGVTAVYGTRSIGVNGNPNVVATTLSSSNPGAIGYADIGEVLTQGAPYALVNKFDPAKFGLNASGVQTPLTITAANLLTGKVIDGVTANPVPGSGSATVDNCVRVVNPTWKLTTQYPILDFSNLAAYYQGNGSPHNATIQALFNLFYDHAHRPALPVGYAYIDGAAPFATSIKATIKNCVNP